MGDPRLPLPFESESENPRIPGGLEEGVLPLSPGPVSPQPHPSQPRPILRSFINILWAAWMAGSTLRDPEFNLASCDGAALLPDVPGWGGGWLEPLSPPT